MNAARPARGVLSRCLQHRAAGVPAAAATAIPSRPFHSTSCKLKKKSRFRNVKASEMGLTSPEKLEQFTQTSFPEYTAEEKEILRQRYTPEQFEALEAGEAAIDPKDLTVQGRMRDDPYRLEYLEDFAHTHPVIDQKPEQPVKPRDFKFLGHKEWVDEYMEKMAATVESKMQDTIGRAVARSLRKVKGTNPEMIDFTEEELKDLEDNPELRRKFLIDSESDGAYADLEREAAENPTAAASGSDGGAKQEWWDEIDKTFYEEMQKSLGGDKNPLEPSKLEQWRATRGEAGTSALAPELGKVPGVKGLYKPPQDPEDEGLDDAGVYQDIKYVTGMKVRDILAIPTKKLVSRNVSNQTRLGKIRSSAVIYVAGNADGRLGIGEAKSTDLEVANQTARLLAIRNMRPVRRYENRTIYGDIDCKISGTVVQLRSRPPGFGLRVSHRIFEMARLAGIHDLAAKIPRSRNPMNTVKAAYHALMNQPDPEQMAIGRGKKMVDARKVYYGGSVH